MAENQSKSLPSQVKSLQSEPVPFDFIDFWTVHRTKILLAAAAVVAMVIAFLYWRHSKEANLEAAESAFGSVKNDDYSRVIANYPATPTAARALLLAADQQFKAGRYDDAVATYQSFQSQFPEHPLAEAAPFGITACLEAKEQYQLAIDGYNRFIKSYPRSFLTASARLGVGRCYEALGKWEEARQSYESTQLLAPQSPFKQEMVERLAVVKRKLRAANPSPKDATPDTGTVTAPNR